MSCNITVRFHRISHVRCAVVSVVETECVSVTNEQRYLFFKTGYHLIPTILCTFTPSIHSFIHPSIHPIPSHSIPSHPIHSSIPSHPIHPSSIHLSHPFPSILPIPSISLLNFPSLVHADLIWLLHKLQKINPFNRSDCNLSS